MGKCPHCGSRNIRRRYRRHRRYKWRCRRCNGIFRSPRKIPRWILITALIIIGTIIAYRMGYINLPAPIVEPINNFQNTVLPTVTSSEPAQKVSRTLESTSKQITKHAPEIRATEVTKVGELTTPKPKVMAPSPNATKPNVIARTPTVLPTTAAAPSPDNPVKRHYQERQYMLTLINEARAEAGLDPVELGANAGAQMHADSALKNCFASHWGIDGLKPYMRYTLAGGYQSNSENGHGSDYCIKAHENYTPVHSIKAEIRDAMKGWLKSPGHRRNILDKHHKKVSIGIAWDRYNVVAYQHFEGDYIEYSRLPEIDESGTLHLSATLRNGAILKSKRDLGIQIFYDPPPQPLTRGQVSRTYCYGHGRQVASLREPLSGNRHWSSNSFTKEHDPCPDPRDVSPDAPPARSLDHAHNLWQEAFNAAENRQPVKITVPWITASKWDVAMESFSVKADIAEVTKRHGPGVYTVSVCAEKDDESIVVSDYSIFHEIMPPDPYTSRESTPVATPSQTSSLTPTPPAHIASPTPTSTPIPPTTRIEITSDYAIRGYRHDGTAEVEATFSISNSGTEPYTDNIPVTLSCDSEQQKSYACNQQVITALEDGHSTDPIFISLALPQGSTTLTIDYKPGSSHKLDIQVPHKIIGVSRKTWDCYSDRSRANNPENAHGCYGWGSNKVEKWQTNAIIKTWLTGDENYIKAFKEILEQQLAPALGLTFEYVETESEADLTAALGVPKNRSLPKEWQNCPHAWGCGGPSVIRDGRILSGHITIYHTPLMNRFEDDPHLIQRAANGVFLHEALHALAPTGHANRHSVVLSIMGHGSHLSHIDKAMLALNYHPLVKPNMSMKEVRELIIFDDQLIDTPPKEELTTKEFLERTFAAMLEIDTMRMKIKAQWTGGGCNATLGKNDWATLETADFREIDDPRIAFLVDGKKKIFIFNSGKNEGLDNDGWHHYYTIGQKYRAINREQLWWTTTAWFVKNSKLHYTIWDVLRQHHDVHYKTIEQDENSTTIKIDYDSAEVGWLSDKPERTTLTMTVDNKTLQVKEYEYYHHTTSREYCSAYEERAKDIEYDIRFDIPQGVKDATTYKIRPFRNGEQ